MKKMSFVRTAARAIAQTISPIIDAEDMKIIGVALVVVLAVGVALIPLAGLAGVAVASFEVMRGL